MNRTPSMRVVTKFDNPTELNRLAMSLQDAAEKTVTVQDFGESKQHKAILNEQTNRISCIANKNYTLVQHRGMVQQVSDALSSFNLNAYGEIVDMGDKVYVHAFFKDKIVPDGTSRGIHLGCRFSNSYDLSCGINFSLYGMRIECANQMHMKNLLSRVSKKHIGEIDVMSMTKDFITQAVEQVEPFALLVEAAMEDSIEWSLMNRMLEAFIPCDKHRTAIMDRLTESPEVTKWEIYNAITNYASHDGLLKNSVIDMLQNKSCTLLEKSLHSLVPEEKEVMVE